MSILDDFTDWTSDTATFSELAITNTNGEVTEAWTDKATCRVWLYTQTTNLLDQSGKLQIIDVMNIIYNPAEVVNITGQTFDVTKTIKATINGIEYFIEGKNNVLQFDEMEILIGRRDAA